MKTLETMTEPELRKFMNTVCRSIVGAAELEGVEPPLFVVVLFNDPKVAQYGSNCQREGIIEAMRETADRLEKKQDVPR
jgi:hypothetical protein